ncbi:TadE family type IV pilus minor pilin [Georgenia sp. SYP-B2076]|uniref:TadE family type IV pilus minor pilin n=1 Tax=Georgenia sp. SYP-B2076 TaxID=2495881 RepID=UPI001F0BC2C5|nr:TadE family type IV pilus minor pilin [Georgenia sp. SYP-B2076]
MTPHQPPTGGAGRPRPSAGGAERGSVTAELALALPGVVLLLVALLTAASAALTQVRVADAARAGARAAALGEPYAAVADLTARLAGADAVVRVRGDGSYLVVEVTQDLPGPLGLADLRATASARAVPEPGVPG